MTLRERFIAALERRPVPGRVPHFELVFFLTMEALGKVHPSQRHYEQWNQMSESERALHRNEMADIYIETAQKYEHSAIFLHPNPDTEDETLRLIDLVREKSGDTYFLMLHGDPTYAIPSGADMMEQAAWFYEKMDDALAEADRRVEAQLACCERLKAHGGLDGFALCSDYCFNDNPFLPPDLFAILITPYLKRVIAGMREMGFYVIKHTDGNILPILDQLVDANPHALHSLDPQGGVDIAEVKRQYGDRVCLIGNVNCGLLTSGSDEEVIQSARYCIQHGMPGGGYVFSTSNCAFTGLALARYELMWKVWHEEAIYAGE
ncbi:MAG: uroporphyrinogen decarboxylase family protein [Candidatus Hydrogenedentales bacterium]|jgi:uroporphyrinogen decarboxylase